MKTYKTFRNVNQVINEVFAIACKVAEVSESCLVISDSKIDAELLRNSTAEQRAAGITIFVREHGTQFAHAEDVAEVRAAWGPQIVRTIEISKERGGLWVVALDCATRYDKDGQAIDRTTEQMKADAVQAREVATMAMRCAVLTQSATDIKAAQLAVWHADALAIIAESAENCDKLMQPAEFATEANEEPETPALGQSGQVEEMTEAQAAEFFGPLGLADGIYSDLFGLWYYEVSDTEQEAEIVVPLTSGRFLILRRCEDYRRPLFSRYEADGHSVEVYHHKGRTWCPQSGKEMRQSRADFLIFAKTMKAACKTA